MSIEKGKISGLQLMFLVTGFVQGSILLIAFAADIARKDTWLVVISGLVVFIPFALSYVYLAKRFPGMNLVQINDAIYGKYFGKAVSIYYIYFFLIVLSLNIRDLGNFYTTFLMPDTPLLFFLLVFTLVCAYAVRHGIEIIARTSPLFVAIATFVISSTFLLLLPSMNFSNFLPVFELPLNKFVQGTHIIATIPFGETVIFLMVMAALSDTKHMVRYTIIGLLFGALSLLLIAIRNTAALGNTVEILTSPSFQAARLIDIGNVFTRMDILVGIGQTSLLFLKCSLFYYAAVVSLSQLLQLRSYLPLVLPVAGIEIILAAIIYQSTPEHVEASKATNFIIFPLLFIIPPLSLLIARIRNLPKWE